MKNPSGDTTVVIGCGGDFVAVRGYGEATELLSLFVSLHFKAKAISESGATDDGMVKGIALEIRRRLDAATLTKDEAAAIKVSRGGLN